MLLHLSSFLQFLVHFCAQKMQDGDSSCIMVLKQLLRCRQAAEDFQRHVFQRVAHFLAGNLERHGENRLVVKESIQRSTVSPGVYIRQ